MNRREKLLSVLMLLTFLVCWGSVSVFAQGESGGNGMSGPASSLAPSSRGNPGPSKASSAPQASSAPPAASSRPKQSSSSRRAKRTANRVSSRVSSPPSSSSAAESGESSPAGEEETISLPSVGSVPEEDPLSSAAAGTENVRKMNWTGLLSWACIGLGVLVVLIVVLSNRRPPRGMGRKRYRRPKRSNKKRLLNDKYYRHINRY